MESELKLFCGILFKYHASKTERRSADAFSEAGEKAQNLPYLLFSPLARRTVVLRSGENKASKNCLRGSSLETELKLFCGILFKYHASKTVKRSADAFSEAGEKAQNLPYLLFSPPARRTMVLRSGENKASNKSLCGSFLESELKLFCGFLFEYHASKTVNCASFPNLHLVVEFFPVFVIIRIVYLVSER